MKVTPGQPFEYGGKKLVLEQAEDGSLEIKESGQETVAATTFQDIGAEIDQKLDQATKALKKLSPASHAPPLFGLG